MEQLQHRMNVLFGLPERRHDELDLELTAGAWSPLVDIAEDDKEYLVKAELPETKRDEIHVSVDDGVLTIRGERKIEHEEKNRKYHRVERAYGHFARSFALPEDSDGSRANAEFKDGVLKVHLPKNPEAKPKSIDIKVD